MINPILQMIANGPKINNMLKNFSDPQQLYNNLMQNNPQFKQFVEENNGKSPEEIAAKYGVDINTIKLFLK